MKDLLKRLKERTVNVDGIEMVPLSIIKHEIKDYEVEHIQDNLEAIQLDVRAILSSLQGEAKDILND